MFNRTSHRLAWMTSCVRLLVAAVLLISSTSELEALAQTPTSDFLNAQAHFLRNQEKIRLETEALSQQATSSHPLLHRKTFPYPIRLFRTFGDLTAVLQRPIAWSRILPARPAWLTWENARAALPFVLLAASVGHAFLNGSPEALQACGVLGMRYFLPKELRQRRANRAVMPELERRIFRGMNKITVDRGEHESGMYFRLREAGVAVETLPVASEMAARLGGADNYRWVGDKVVNIKRESMPERLETAVVAVLEGDARKHWKEELPESVLMTAHDRFSTGSDPTIEAEAHPHFGETKRVRAFHSYQDGHAAVSLRPIDLTIAHNGDLDAFAWWYTDAQPTDEGEIKKRLVAILQTPNPLRGDSRTIALLLSLLRTQGDAFASVRLAFQRALPWQDQARLPTEAEMVRWADVLEETFQDLVPQILAGAATLADVQNGKRALFRARFLENLHAAATADPTFLGPLPSDSGLGDSLGTFAEHAVYGFLDNDLFQAMRNFSQRAVGTFGVCAASTVDEDPVFYSSQQSFYLARDPVSGRQGWDSERRALAIQVKNTQNEWQWAFRDRLELNQERKEVARFRSDGSVEIYDGIARQMLPSDAVEKRWVDMTRSPFIKPMKVNGAEPKPLKASLQEIAPLSAAIETDHASATSYNRLTMNVIAGLVARLAVLQAQHRLPRGTHIALVGYRTDFKLAEQFGDFLKSLFEDLNVEWIPANSYLEDPDEAVRKHRIREDTLVIAIDRSGGEFATVNAVMELKTRVHQIFGITGGEHGDLDTVLASVLGQKFDPGAKFSRRLIVTGEPWPRKQALVANHLATTQTLNRLAEEIVLAVQQVKARYPHAEILGLQYTAEEIAALRTMKPGLLQAVSSLTGHNGKGEPIDAPVNRTIVQTAEEESRDFAENRALKWLFRLAFAAPIYFLGREFGWLPDHLIPGLGADLPGFGLLRMGFNVAVAVFVEKLVIPLLYRTYWGRQVQARVGGTRVLAVVDEDVFYYAKVFYRYLFAQSRPDATAFVDGAHPSGEVNSDFLSDTASMMKRGDLQIKSQTDPRFLGVGEVLGRNHMASTQLRVNRSSRMAGTVLAINRFFYKVARRIRIPFGYTRTITFRRHGVTNINAEDRSIVLETHYFPLPRAMTNFFDDLEENGLVFAANQKAEFFAARDRYRGTRALFDDRVGVAGELADLLQITDPGQRALWWQKFEPNALAIFELSDDERARQLRLQRWVRKRYHSIEHYLAMASVFGEAFIDPIAHSSVPNESFPAGDSQPGTLIFSTAITPGTRVAQRLAKHESRLKDISIATLGNGPFDGRLNGGSYRLSPVPSPSAAPAKAPASLHRGVLSRIQRSQEILIAAMALLTFGVFSAVTFVGTTWSENFGPIPSPPMPRIGGAPPIKKSEPRIVAEPIEKGVSLRKKSLGRHSRKPIRKQKRGRPLRAAA